jgi:hypothetical protein
MNKEELQTEGIIKEESVGYLKSSLNMLPGNLVLTPRRIVLDAHKASVNIWGLIGMLFKHKAGKDSTIFNLEHSNIQSVVQGKHGVNKNVLEIKDNQNNTYKIIVKDYPDWESALNKAK